MIRNERSVWNMVVPFLGVLLLLLMAVLFQKQMPSAATKDINLNSYSGGNYTATVGDGGRLVYSTGAVASGCAVSVQYRNSGSADVMQVGSDGTYTAKKSGSASVAVTVTTRYPEPEDDYGYYRQDNVSTYYYTIEVYPDMTNVTLAKSSVTSYYSGYNYGTTFEIKVNSTVPLSDTDDNVKVSVTSSNGDMSVSCSLSNNILKLDVYGSGSSTVSVTINGKVFTIQVKVVGLTISTDSVLLVKGKSKTVKVKGTTAKITWKSTDKKIATVSSVGKIKGKKNGTVVITATVGDIKLGCVVSVTSSKMSKVIKYAQKIGKTCKYSQPNRMQAGYYDCSSLVWRAYTKYTSKSLGNKNYAPVAADQAQWCAGHGKIISKSMSSSQINKMKFQPGDLMFETGAGNGRYKGIYHVEMFIGYGFAGFDSAGKPVLYSKWANRASGYYGLGGYIGRP